MSGTGPRRIFTAPIDRLIAFAKGVVTDILKFVKDAILKPLAALAQGTRGYDLLCALLGEDPITGEPVPRTADTLIGGFMKLIGQEEIWENLKKGNAVARAWAWFQGALAGLLGFARAIPRRIIDTLTSLTIQDIVTVAGAFAKIVGAFVNIAGEFYSWAFNQVISLLEILFSVVAPAVMPYLKKAQAAFMSILKNPIGFVGNLVQAGKLGFQMFAGNILGTSESRLDQMDRRPPGRGRRLYPAVLQPHRNRQTGAVGVGPDLAGHPRQTGENHPRAGAGGSGKNRRHPGHPGERRPGGSLGADQSRTERTQRPTDRSGHPNDLHRGGEGRRSSNW